MDQSDEALYHRVRKGDLAAFETLYERYERRLFGYLLRLLRNRQDAEDVFHEAFLSVLKSPEVRFSEGSFCTWIYRIGRNLSLNHIRKGRREEGRIEALSTIQRAEPDRGNPEDDLGKREAEAALSQALSRLPEGLADVYHLRAQGLSYEEVAQVLCIPLGTVKSRMNQLVRTLKEEVALWTAQSYKMN